MKFKLSKSRLVKNNSRFRKKNNIHVFNAADDNHTLG